MAHWCREWLQPGSVAVDVGANVGTFSREFIEAAGRDGVWAIEPHPDCYSSLREVLAPDHVIAAAVSDTEGDVVLYRSLQTEHGSLYAPNVLAANGSQVTRAVTLDGLQARGELPRRIDLVKVDAQGAELAILRGAETLIRTQHPVWFLELWPSGLREAGASVPAIVDLLQAAGYRVVNQPSWDEVTQFCANLGGHSSMDILVTAT